MSIRTFNNLMQKPGCVPVMSGFLLLAMIVGGMRSCNNGQGPNGGDNPQADKIVASIGDYAISENMINKEFDAQMSQYQQLQPGFQLGAKDEAGVYAQILDQNIRFGLNLIEANKLGVPISTSDILKDEEQKLNQELLQVRQQMIQAKDLSETSKESDFVDLIKKRSGKTPDEIKKNKLDEVKSELDSNGGKARYAALLAPDLVSKVLASRLKISDDDLKASYKTIQVRRILFNGTDAKAQVDKAQADLKAGQDFVTVANRYSKDPATPKKKPGDVVTTLNSMQLGDPAYAPLLTLKAGEQSSPLTLPEGTVIYKIESIKMDLPKDFDKNKEALRLQLAQSKASQQFQSDVTQLQKTTTIAWKDDGWKALYEIQQLSQDHVISKADRDQKLKAIASSAKAAAGNHSKATSLAWYSATNVLSTELSGADAKALVADRIDAIKSVSDYVPGPDLQLELADIYSTQKSVGELTQALVTAASQNTDYSQKGAMVMEKIRTDLRMNDALLPADAKKSIQDAMITWAKSKAEQDKAQQSAAEEQAKLEKQSKADQKKLEEQQKQAAAANAKK